MQVTNYAGLLKQVAVLYRNLNRLTLEVIYFLSFQIWIVKLIFLTFAMAKDDRRERHRSLLHFP